MLGYIKHRISVASCLISLSAKRQLESLFWFLSFLVALPIRCATGLVIIYVLVDKFSPLYGWNLDQLLFLYGLSYMSDGLASTFGSQARKIETFILRGEFDRFLVRPFSVLFQLLFRFIYLGGIIETFSGLLILIYGCHRVGFSPTAPNIIKLVTVVLGASLIRMAFLIILGSVAFWTKRSNTLVWVGDEIVRKTTQYPISIYPDIFQALFTFILPFGFIGFYPASEFFGFGNEFSLPLNFAFWTPVIGILTFFISARLFESGLRKYESAGS